MHSLIIDNKSLFLFLLLFLLLILILEEDIYYLFNY